MIFKRVTETVIARQCHGCAAEVPASDNFCRQCGVLQRVETLTSATGPHWSERRTKTLQGGEPSHELLSGSLVNTVTKAVAVKTAPFRLNRFGARLVAGIIVIPMWLLIVLLSPLDAYAAAKIATSRIDC
jgi:hypothetical protein